MEFFYQSSTRYLSSERSDFSTSWEPCRDVNGKMANLGNEFENDKNWNEEELGPYMNLLHD